jgi:TonB-linked SusC/RagA family outer membrane protein
MQKNFTVNGMSVRTIARTDASPHRANVIWKVMKISMAQVTLAAIFTGMVMANDNYAQKVLDREVNLHAEGVTLKKVLHQIEVSTKVKFVYSRSHLMLDQEVWFQSSGKKLGQVLEELLVPRDIQYRVQDVNDYIVLTQETAANGSSLETAGDDAVSIVRPVTGKVSDSNGAGIPGVSILVKGTSTGTVTDANGNFNIDVPDTGAILVFSSIGYRTQEVAVNALSTIDITMEEETRALGEVVVTALGIQKESKRLGYAASSVDTELLTTNRSTNVGNTLQGKVAGVNVSVPASGPGGSSKIRIRGQSSFGGDNSPLIIVNGVPINNNAISAGYQNPANPTGGSSDGGDGLQSINQDDIESMTVLKGAAASALYGFRAKDGAIIITTKSGTTNSGIGVEYSVNFQASEALDYTDFQYEYGQGENGVRPTTVAEAQSSGIWSFGVKFDGQPTPQFDGSMQPYLPNRDRVKDFYETGTELTNSVALSGGNEKGNFRLSFAKVDAKGIVPNSDYDKKILNLGMNYKFTPKLSMQLNANYSNELNHNPPQIGIEGFSVNTTIFTMANSIDVDWLKNYKDPNGNEMPLARFTGRNNPYWVAYEHFENIKRDRLFGNASLRYQFTKWLYVQGRVGQDYYTRPYQFNRPTGSRNLGAAVTGFNGTFYQNVSTFRETNLDFLVGAEHTVGKFGMNVILGGNQMQQVSDNLSTSITNFYVRGLYTIANGQIKNPNYSYSEKRVNSIYASAEFSFNNYLFLNVTGRNDWFSTLNPKSNSYLYPSVSTSFVFSDVFDVMPSWLSFGKLRAAYAEVGGDTDPYTNSLYYSIAANPFNNSGLGSISSSVSPNPALRPLKVKETEVGLDLRLFKGLVGIDFSAYQKYTVDEILNVDISISSGFNQTKVNIGRLKNEGVEMLLTIVPVNRQLRWETVLNSAYNKSEVLELANGQERFDVGVGQYFGTISHEVGQPLASVRSFDYKRNENGDIITSAGKPLLGDLKTFGSAIPKWTGGWLNTFTYKRIRLFTQIDYKFGAVVLSNSNFNFLRHGLSKGSLEGREGGALLEGFEATGEPNTTRVPAEDFYSAFRNLGERFVYDASFIRLRSLSLGYDLSPLMKNTFVKRLTVSAIANNVFMIKKYLDNLDPESQISVSDNFQGIDTHALPTTRSYGVNLSVKF